MFTSAVIALITIALVMPWARRLGKNTDALQVQRFIKAQSMTQQLMENACLIIDRAADLVTARTGVAVSRLSAL